MLRSPKRRPATLTLRFLGLAFFAFLYLVIYPNDFRLQSFIAVCRSPSSSPVDALDPITPEPDFRLLLGILTLPDHYERRHLLRLVYSLQQRQHDLTAQVDVRFVFCRLTKEEQRVLVALEIMRYADIIILNCTENMNQGKTYAYYASLPSLFGGDGETRYDFVAKADDDIYFRLPKLIESLNKMPREDLYYGFVIPCTSMDPFRDYMSGMGYVVSWDLVEWIATSEIARNNTEGPEDMMTGKWLHWGGKGKNRYNTKYAMYDYPIPVPIDECSHDFSPETIAVHRLKDNMQWARTLQYLNVTDGLKPSKLIYHI